MTRGMISMTREMIKRIKRNDNSNREMIIRIESNDIKNEELTFVMISMTGGRSPAVITA